MRRQGEGVAIFPAQPGNSTGGYHLLNSNQTWCATGAIRKLLYALSKRVYQGALGLLASDDGRLMLMSPDCHCSLFDIQQWEMHRMGNATFNQELTSSTRAL